MDMTQTMAPRLSLTGIALAAALAVVGWIATPALSCPAEPQASEDLPAHTDFGCRKRHKKEGKPCRPGCDGRRCGCERSERRSGGHPPNFHDHEAKLHRVAPAAFYVVTGNTENDELEDRISRVEDQLSHVIDRLNQTADRLGERVERRRLRMPRTPRTPRTLREPAPRVPPVPGAELGSHAMILAPHDDLVRTYELPEGPLDALTALMARSDVPIAVRPTESLLEVHATAAQHAVFQRFVDLIHPEDEVRGYRLPSGKLEALTELMIRPDVALRIQPGEDHVKVHGTDLEQEAFKAFVEMIAPETEQMGVAWPTERQEAEVATLVRKREHGKKAIEQRVKAKHTAKVRKECEQKRVRKHSSHHRTEQTSPKEATKTTAEIAMGTLAAVKPILQDHARSLEEQVRAFREQADALMHLAKQVEEQARRLEHQAERLDGEMAAKAAEAELAAEAGRVALIAKASALAEQAAAIGADANTLETQFEASDLGVDKPEE